MKTFGLIVCALAMACALPSCDYDDVYPYGYTSVGYRSGPYYGSSYYSPPLYGRSYVTYGPTYTYRRSYPRTYTSTRYLAPVTTRTYVSGYPYPLSRHMSVGGYGYVPPVSVSRLNPWPLR